MRIHYHCSLPLLSHCLYGNAYLTVLRLIVLDFKANCTARYAAKVFRRGGPVGRSINVYYYDVQVYKIYFTFTLNFNAQ